MTDRLDNVIPKRMPGHNPHSEETLRRVNAMAETICTSCDKRCGQLSSCPLLLARWFGDWSGEQS